ncbi:MAG: PH domain-containing protein [Micromonosporaceae bacterium]|nr:PH domain-containing protein [Micromonosporaceae bacterium]
MTLGYDRTLPNGTIVAVPKTPRKAPRIRFRHNIAVAVAGLCGVVAAIPLAGARVYLLPILLIPSLIMVWGWRAGVDVDADGLTVRALLGSRTFPWRDVTGFAAEGRRVVMLLDGDRAVRLPAVSADDVPAMLKAGGQALSVLDSEDRLEAEDSEPPDAPSR